MSDGEGDKVCVELGRIADGVNQLCGLLSVVVDALRDDAVVEAPNTLPLTGLTAKEQIWPSSYPEIINDLPPVLRNMETNLALMKANNDIIDGCLDGERERQQMNGFRPQLSEDIGE